MSRGDCFGIDLIDSDVGEAFSTVTMTCSKRERHNQRLRRELAANDLQIVDLTEQNAKLSEQVQSTYTVQIGA